MEDPKAKEKTDATAELLRLRQRVRELERLELELDSVKGALRQSETRCQYLYEKFQQQTAQLQQALDFEATLKRITDKVRDSLDESQILKTAVEELAHTLGVERCNTATYDIEQQTLTILYEYAKIHPQQGRVSSMAVIADVYPQLAAGQCIQFCRLPPAPCQDVKVRLACPIFDEHGLIGSLWLCHQREQIFDQAEVRLVKQVASQCAIAIRQAQLYQAVQTEVAKLQQLNQLKDDFLSTVSHELRTPLSNMKVAIHMLKLSPSEQKRAQYCDILDQECQRETDLIQNLLDLQRLESGEQSLELERLYLQDLLPRILEPFKSRIDACQLSLQAQIPAELSPVCSHLSSLERIWVELLNNACKYTPPGGKISVTAQQVFNPAPAIRVVICNEAEILAQDLPLIFNKFYRTSQADRWKHGGTGLGLALTQKLVEELGGRISVESRAGKTRFIVEFPTDLEISR